MSEEPKLIDFGRYGRLALGSPKYAAEVPHHMPHPDAPGVYGGPYVQTHCPASEELFRRIFEDRDPAATAFAAVEWRGEDGEPGEHFLMRQVDSHVELVSIPPECIEDFDGVIVEEREEEGIDDAGERVVRLMIRQIDWKAKLRGRIEDE